MNTTRNRTVLALGIALALAASGASATNGYYTHGTGTKSKGQAGAGSADPQEVLILATNPAGIAFVPESIDAGLGIFSPMRHYETTPSQAPGACFAPGQCLLTVGPNDLYSQNEFFPIPHVAMNWALSDANHVAAAFYARGGMNTKWEGGTVTYDPFFGNNPSVTTPVTLPGTFGDNTAGVDLMQGFLNLTYARKFSDQFSLGASAIIAIQRFEARGLDNFAPFTHTYVSTFNPATGGQLPKNLSDNGHDMSYGYGGSVGFQWNPAEMFSFAAAYTTKMSMSEFSNYKDLFAENGDFDMPSTWTIGVAFRPNAAWTLMFDVQDISYSDAKAVSNGIENLFNCPILPGGTDLEGCLGGKRGAGFGWEDMTVYKVGASWAYSDTWTWRAGFSTTDQPIPNDQMTFNILAPGVMEEHFTVGFSQKLKNGNEVNFSFMYAPEVTVRGPQNFDPTQNVMFEMQQIEAELSYSWKR
jgi:long-chain fatty acid transport protein